MVFGFRGGYVYYSVFFVLILFRKEDIGFRLKCLRIFICNWNEVIGNYLIILFLLKIVKVFMFKIKIIKNINKIYIKS